MKRRLSRSGIAAVCTLAAAIVLTACIQIDVESEFATDGSATHSMAMTVDRSLLDGGMLDGELEAELDFEEAEREAQEAGFETERIDTADRVGLRISTQVVDNEDLGDVLNELFDAAGGEGPPVDGFQGGFSETSGLAGSTYRFELIVDGDALFEENQGDFDGEVEDEFDLELGREMLGQFINLTYTASLPGEITEHNGTTLGSGSVQWTIPFEGTETFFAESEDGSGFSMALILGVGLGFLALTLIVVGGIMMMRGQKTPNHPVADSAGTGITGRTDVRY